MYWRHHTSAFVLVKSESDKETFLYAHEPFSRCCHSKKKLPQACTLEGVPHNAGSVSCRYLRYEGEKTEQDMNGELRHGLSQSYSRVGHVYYTSIRDKC